MFTEAGVAMRPGKRYVLICVGIALLLGAVVLGLMRWQHTTILRTLESERLQASRSAQRVVEEQRAIDIATRAELIAGNQSFVGYVEQALGGALPGVKVDTASIVDLLGERSGQLGLTLAAVLDEEGRLVAATQAFTQRRRFGDDPLFVKARDSQTTATGLWLDVDRLLQIAIRPLAADGSSEGFLVVGMLVNQNLVEPIAQIGATQVAVIANTAGGRMVGASTLDSELQQELLAKLPAGAAAGREPFALRLGKTEATVSMTPLFGSTVGDLVVVATDAAGATPQSLLRQQSPLLAAAGLVLLVLLGAAWMLWSRVLRPIDALSELIERAASGDRHLKFQENAGALRRIAKAFNALMASLQGRAL